MITRICGSTKNTKQNVILKENYSKEERVLSENMWIIFHKSKNKSTDQFQNMRIQILSKQKSGKFKLLIYLITRICGSTKTPNKTTKQKAKQLTSYMFSFPEYMTSSKHQTRYFVTKKHSKVGRNQTRNCDRENINLQLLLCRFDCLNTWMFQKYQSERELSQNITSEYFHMSKNKKSWKCSILLICLIPRIDSSTNTKTKRFEKELSQSRTSIVWKPE